MKAATYQRYGPPEVVTIRDVPTPTPSYGEVRVRIRATTVSTGDWRARSLDMPAGFGVLGRVIFGVRRPRQPILGTEFSGVVDMVGAGVNDFTIGDEVFAFAGSAMGAHAEYRCMPANGLVTRRPPNLSFEQAAALSFGGMTMLGFFRRGALARGERVLVNGALGTVGSAAVQLAHYFGAEVTAVCRSESEAVVNALGAHHVVDYTKTDFTRGGERYDVVVDTVGNAGYARARKVLAFGGRLIGVHSDFSAILSAPLARLTNGHRVVVAPSKARAADHRQLAEIASAGAFTPLIDQCFPFERIVDAHRRVDAGHKRGSVVVTLD